MTTSMTSEQLAELQRSWSPAQRAAYDRLNPSMAVAKPSKAPRNRREPKPIGRPEYLRFKVPMATNTQAAGSQGHWAPKQREADAQRSHFKALEGARVFLPALPAVIRMTRVGRPCDDDNVVGAFKHIRDGIADAFGVDDGSKFYTWEYDQRKPGKGEAAGVIIEIETKEQLGTKG